MNGYVNYYADARRLSQQAKYHVQEMQEKFPIQISNSVNNTIILDDSLYCSNMYEYYRNLSYHFTTLIPSFKTDPIDTVSAVHKYSSNKSRLFVLNFASYKTPGGKFLQGSSAQEESICHGSTLYNVLSQFPKYYSDNRKNLNNSLYTNRALYTPDIVFMDDNIKANILTCAAPNYTSAKKWYNVPSENNMYELESRINFVMDCFSTMCVNNVNYYTNEYSNILILGAFGCGVFGQDPMNVSYFFRKQIMSGLRNCFNKIIFAIPPGDNLDSFKDTFQERRLLREC